ncbi:phage tail protein [Escherichia coli]|uniref:phage tail-collar fiber domain-containing protein n=1 Tax=Escherichia coli TaxID=562 RepID=UPI0013733E78|nr:phage tail protein [Escherichia coli]EFI5739747.1 phage tail protein [Escherichia coli]EGO6652005.1 phage tail protein [Escherichia coli]EGO6727264.1 phage tail protein [Escherichia coli]EGO9654516.1 phage tail protein [Escherichia coli]EKE4293449.1 phage tail protein [Escherichia coli]
MTVKYYAILTNQGAARLANATMLGSKLNLTQMAVGDANGVLPTPDPAQTKLINQKRIAPLNLLSVDPNNQSQIIAEQIIPENEGGFWIREIGLYDDEGVLIAVANCPETYKPQLQEGSGRTQTIRMILVVTNTEAITLKIDPSVVLATRKYVDDEVLELKLYVDDQMRNHIAAQDPHTQYAQKHNPTFTGEPKAPTPAAGNNTTRIATTEFVQAAITALINGAPATLDTLKEIAAAINNDPKFSTTINNALAGKQPLDNTLTNLSGKDVAGLLAYLRLEKFQQADDATRIFSPDGDVYLRIDNAGWYFARKNAGKIPVSTDAGGTGATNAKDAVFNLGLGAGTPAIGIPFFWPLAAMPNTVMDEWSDMVFLKPNGASFSAATYPKLAKVWPGLVIPDMRGEFPRIWDDGRGVDSGRALLSYQGDASRNITGSFGGTTNNDTCSVLGQGAGVFANGTSLVTPTNGSVIGSATRPVTMTLDISRQVPTASEFRPRNFALNFLIRAK